MKESWKPTRRSSAHYCLFCCGVVQGKVYPWIVVATSEESLVAGQTREDGQQMERVLTPIVPNCFKLISLSTLTAEDSCKNVFKMSDRPEIDAVENWFSAARLFTVPEGVHQRISGILIPPIIHSKCSSPERGRDTDQLCVVIITRSSFTLIQPIARGVRRVSGVQQLFIWYKNRLKADFKSCAGKSHSLLFCPSLLLLFTSCSPSLHLHLSFTHLPPLILISPHSPSARIFCLPKNTPRKHEIFILIAAVAERSRATKVKAPVKESPGDEITCACVACKQMYLIILTLSAARETTLSSEISRLSATEPRCPLSLLIK